MKSSTKIDVHSLKEFYSNINIFGITFIILGFWGILLHIALPENTSTGYLFVFVLVSGFGLGILLLINKATKEVIKNDLTANYDFEESQVNIQILKSGEQFSTATIKYKDLVKVKETKNYLFLLPKNSQTLPVLKDSLTSEELSLLKAWIQNARINKK